MDSVALVKYKQNIRETIEEGLKLLGGFGTLKSPVIIKPNICTISDGTGFSLTHSETVEALVDLVLKNNPGLSIKIVESDSQSKYAEQAFEKFGYTTLEEDMQTKGFDVALVNLSQSKLVPVKFDGAYFENPELPDLISEPNYFISLAVAKTHYLSFLTAVLKNQFGLLPRKDQGYYHSRIDDVIVDLNRIVQPSLCIVDARVGVEGWNGPKTRKLDSFVLGYKPVSVDATLARIMGFEPEQIPHLIQSSKHDLGTLSPIVLGKDIESTVVKFNPPF